MVPKQRRGAVVDFSRIDEAKPTTASPPISWPQNFSYPATLGLRGAYKWEHVHAKSDEQQYRAPAIILRADGWSISNNRRTATKRRKMAGAVELDRLVELIRKCVSRT